MAVIHLAGSIALFLFGGVTAFSGWLQVSYQMSCDTSRYVCDFDFGGYAALLIGIGMIIGGIVLAMKSSKPTQEKLEEYGSEELKDYERDYLARQGIKSTKRKPTARRKPAETRESENNFCDNCGKSLRPTAKFCGSCGTSVP